MIAAAGYHDQWFKSSIAFCNTYYICRAGGHDECRTVTRSAYWRKKFPDMLATKQKWYCPICEAGYNTKFGVIVEMIVSRKAFPGVGQADPEE